MSAILIVGKPNSGKSLLFNRLTGLKQKVANFPGITVEVKTGKLQDFEIADFPGVYSVNPLSKDEQISVAKFREALGSTEVKVIVCMLDATRLERSLVLGLQMLGECQKFHKKIIFALNMMDEIRSNQAFVDVQGLENELGAPIQAISARTTEGLDELKEKITWLANSQSVAKDASDFMQATDADPLDHFVRAKKLAQKYGPKTDLILQSQNKLDRVFLSSLWGAGAFVLIMAMLFQSIFSWAAPLMEGLDFLVSSLGQGVAALIENELVKSFFVDAVIGGVGSFLVFVPQIFILTFVIGILEDSGYMARAAVICHRPFSFFGLSGRSFVPLLSGHACAIPAIMAARSIESPKRRLLTMLAIPLTVCSARLPVYGLLVAVFIPAKNILGGLFGLQGLVFFGLYAFGILMALLVSAFLSRTAFKSTNDMPFIVELPPYRWPHWRPLLEKAWSSSLNFITKAGFTIFVVTVVIWVLGYFPNHGADLQKSWLGDLGRLIEPIFAPLGLDWKYGIAVLMSFLAREVFVGTLGTMFGIEAADENVQSLVAHMQQSGITLGSGVALIVFYALALQCAATVGVLKKELGNLWGPLALTLGYGILAYMFALASYHLIGII